MSGQPGDDAAERPAEPSWPDRPAWTADSSASRPWRRAVPRASGATAASAPVGEFPTNRPPSTSWRQRTGALLPGKWAQAVGPPRAGEQQAGPTAAGPTAAGPTAAGPTVAGPSPARAGSAPAAGAGAGAAPAHAAAGAGSGVGSGSGAGRGSGTGSAQAGAGGARFVAAPSGTVTAQPAAGDPPASPGGAISTGGADPGGADPGGGRPRRKFRGALRGELRGRRLALAAAGLALACTMLGGVIGGFIVLHSQQSPINPSYSLGTVPPALTGRPASSVAGIAARVTPSVVMIKVNGGEGTGSGFIIQGGYIVTDNHVVTLDNQVTNANLEVYFSNGQSAPGEVVGRDPYSDIAIVKAKGLGGGLPALTLGNSAGVEVGDPVIAVGSPLGLADTVTSGIVSAVDRPVQPGDTAGTSPQVYFDAIQTDAPINPGNSGGPLVNARGQVIGVDAAIDTLGDNPLTGTQGGSIGLGFAIPVNQARRVAVELIRTGHATHAVIGAVLNLGWGGNGAQIAAGKTGITAGGPAAQAGLMPGDVITRFAGEPVGSAAALLDAVRSAVPGSQVKVTFSQGGQAHTVTMRLGSATS
jgi:putative serine protease PepD